MRLLKILGVIACAICLTSMVYAETQSVKISGDLTVRSIFRNDYDLDKNNEAGAATRTGLQDDWQTYFMTTTEIQVDADLTDNVAGVVRLYNQRDWDVRAKSITAATGFLPGANGYTATDDEFGIGVDLAYIELKEFLYSPLTLKVGRQDLWFGKGFIVGANQQDPQGTINADEYTSVWSFDAIRATLDYDPWTIDAIAAKIMENAIQADDDEDLYGINVGYLFDIYNAEAEGYWFYKRDSSIESWNIKDGNTIHTLGLRGSMDPIENWTLAAETAIQFGQYVGSRKQLEQRDRSGWAIDVSAECRHFQDEFAWKPKLGVEYIYYSGDKNIEDNEATSEGTYTGWDRMYRGKFDTAIREFQGLYYATAQDARSVQADQTPSYPDAADSNQHQIVVSGCVQPTDSLTVETVYANFWQQYETSEISNNTREDQGTYLGSEIDVVLTWDYTEDVQFGLLGAWYFPGDHYNGGNDDVATDLVGTVQLSF